MHYNFYSLWHPYCSSIRPSRIQNIGHRTFIRSRVFKSFQMESDSIKGDEMRRLTEYLGIKDTIIESDWHLLKSFLWVLFLLMIVVPAIAWASPDRRQDLFSVSFPTKDLGWVCGRWGTIMHTSDGGLQWVWQKSGTDFSLTTVRFVNQNIGWAIGDGGTILHTRDGGKMWSPQKSPVSYFLMGAYFVDENTGWIVTEKTTILYTSNGGKTWTIQFSGPDYILKKIHFCDRNNGWAVGEYGYIYHTSNGGKTWQQQAGGFDISNETGEIVAGNILFDVFAMNPTTAWVVGIDGYIAQTKNGGKSWEQFKGVLPGTHLFALKVTSGGTMIVAGDALLMTGTLDGRKFEPAKVNSPITYGWLYDIAPRGGNALAAVGGNGWIYLSEGTESSWRRVR